MKRKLAAAISAASLACLLAACGGGSGASTSSSAGSAGSAGSTGSSGSAAAAGPTTLKVAAFQGGYGAEIYQQVADAYKKVEPNVTIDLTVSKTIAEELQPQVAAGDYPDVVVLGIGGKSGFTDGFVRDRGLEDVTDVLSMTVPGENTTVGDKLTPGITGNLISDPYGDGKTYLMPMYASPTGLVYNKTLFTEKGWTVPTTWDEMWALGDKAKAEGISLFTYPTAGYLDSFFPAALADAGGLDFFNEAMTYKTDIWKSDNATSVFNNAGKLLSYAAPTTVGYANAQDFTKNQQSILDGTTLFMPNGSWISNEMKDAPRTPGFQWAMTPVPTQKSGDKQYLTTSVESAWVPAKAENKDAAKKFLAFLYSDTAADIFAKAGAVQPIKGLSQKLTGDAASFYSLYDQPNVEAVVGGFAATNPVPGVDVKAALYDTADAVISGTTSATDWQNAVNDASNQLTDEVLTAN